MISHSSSSIDPPEAASPSRLTPSHSVRSEAPQKPCGVPAAERLSVAVMTPWDQQCGNAEYAKRLAVGLRAFADVTPCEMVNFNNPDLEYGRLRRWLICRRTVLDVNALGTDIVHIQHEFCFFGRRIREANRNFRRAVRSLRKPIVVTLHTWPWSRPLNRVRPRWLRWFRAFQSRRGKRHLLKTLKRVDAIVVHSKDTYQQLINESPRWKKKTFLIPIAVEPMSHQGKLPPIRKRPDEQWITIPGFVSRYKGHSHALHALALLPENFRLVIAGGVHPNDKTGHDYWMQILAEADAFGLQDRIIFTGFLNDPQQQAAVLHQADCFLLPYDEVGQSGSAVLADALAHIRPVVTSTARSMFVYRGNLDTVGSSVSVDVTDAARLAATIERCVTPDQPTTLQMRRHQQAVYKTYSLDQTQQRYQQVYQSVRNKRNRS